MQVNKAKYDENNTCALMNAVGPKAILDATDPLWEYYERRGISSSLRLFKKVFGRQQITVNYSHRNWVWTFTNGKATINCLLSVQGIAWEYDRANSDEAELLPLMKQIVARLTK